MNYFKNAKWITNQTHSGMWMDFVPGERDNSYFIRKNFIISKSIKSARLYVCGLGLGVYYINGALATEDVLTTPFSRYDKTVYFNEYDITHLLKDGENVFGAYLGNGMYNDCSHVWEHSDWRSFPKLICNIHIDFTDGSCKDINSDTSFKSTIGSAVYNHARCGEIYDASLMQKGWNDIGFDDTSWEDTLICRSPGGVLKKAEFPSIRIVEKLDLENIGGNIYTCTKNISGWVRIKVSGKKGDKVSIKYGEALNDDGSINDRINQFNDSDIKHFDTYILSGRGIEEYAPSFVYHGFRYINIETTAEIIEMKAERVHTDLKTVGTFSCSDEMLNKIHDASCLSTLTNYMGIPTDCPQREQNGWTGDALLSSEQALMNFDIVASYKKWLSDFKDVQRPSGQIPAIVPTAWWGYNWGSGPAWDSAMMLIPVYIYDITGDISAIELMWDNMKLYHEFMVSMSDRYLVDYGLGDWCAPASTKQCPSEVTDTAYFYVDTLAMAKCAYLLGKDPSYYEELAKEIKNAFREKYLNDTTLYDNQTFYACCIYQGLLSDDEIAESAKHLNELVINNGYHIDCGILGTKYIFSALSENGYAETVYKMVTNPSCPSYAYWINQGMTTLCEQWSMKNPEGLYDSLNHHMFSEVDMWFYKHIAGIHIKDGNITIKPCFLKNVKIVDASSRGVEVHYDDESIAVTVPKDAYFIVGKNKINLPKGTHTFKRSELK